MYLHLYLYDEEQGDESQSLFASKDTGEEQGGESQSLLASKDTDEEQGGESQSLLAAKDTDASQSQYPQTPNVLWKRKRRRQP